MGLSNARLLTRLTAVHATLLQAKIEYDGEDEALVFEMDQAVKYVRKAQQRTLALARMDQEDDKPVDS